LEVVRNEIDVKNWYSIPLERKIMTSTVLWEQYSP
jgi:hypothetical protein